MTPGGYPAWVRRRRADASTRRIIDALAISMSMSMSDDSPVMSLLDPEVLLVIDNGGIASAASEPRNGRAEVARALAGLMTPETSITMASINGVPGFVLHRDDRVVAAVTGEVATGVLSAIWVVSNPAKLRHWNARQEV
jgi:RNA polymerase sigma-70 factor (ECF subfamily)